jgi:hypothetical protein
VNGWDRNQSLLSKVTLAQFMCFPFSLQSSAQRGYGIQRKFEHFHPE